MPGAYISGPALSVFLGAQLLKILADNAFTFLSKDLPQKRNAPTAAGPGPTAFRELTGNLRPFPAAIIHQFAPGDVKTVTDFGIKIHGLSVTS